MFASIKYCPITMSSPTIAEALLSIVGEDQFLDWRKTVRANWTSHRETLISEVRDVPQYQDFA